MIGLHAFPGVDLLWTRMWTHCQAPMGSLSGENVEVQIGTVKGQLAALDAYLGGC
jgi:hypothetical protein